ncbi:MAG TPA: hypothetical protein VGM50_02445 [Gemmatimonadaceae bacterium]
MRLEIVIIAAAIILAGRFANDLAVVINKGSVELTRLADAAIECLGALLRGLWRLATPTAAVRVDRAFIGCAIIMCCGYVAVANFRLLVDTITIILPIESGAQSLAIVLVLFGGALGLLAHFSTRRHRWGALGLAALLCLVTGLLAWFRTVALQHLSDLPSTPEDAFLPRFMACLAILLQALETLVSAGAVALIGESLSALVMCPALVAAGALLAGLHATRAVALAARACLECGLGMASGITRILGVAWHRRPRAATIDEWIAEWIASRRRRAARQVCERMELDHARLMLDRILRAQCEMAKTSLAEFRDAQGSETHAHINWVTRDSWTSSAPQSESATPTLHVLANAVFDRTARRILDNNTQRS